MGNSGHQKVPINDINVVSAIEALGNRGYSVIGRSDNIINFQRSTKGRHFGNGIAYSIDGIKPNNGVNPRDPLYGSSEPASITKRPVLITVVSANNSLGLYSPLAPFLGRGCREAAGVVSATYNSNRA